MIAAETLFAALLAKAKALGPTLSPPVAAAHVAEWDGEDPTFNPDAAFPSLALQYLGSDAAPRAHIRGASYQVTERFAVYVSTCATAAATAGSQARALLHALEVGLQGWLGDTGVALRRTPGESRRQVAVALERQTYVLWLQAEQSYQQNFDA